MIVLIIFLDFNIKTKLLLVVIRLELKNYPETSKRSLLISKAFEN